ncbi:MAG: DNA mismatch repair endonuclease MutL [Candidatus Binatia bacterium]|nr:DNA mismatch repair endonuclease MutL [Candidatus Binatia bacterium]
MNSLAQPVDGLWHRNEAAGQEPCRVQVLPKDVADQIAAGEVVERPASVVKELVENSLDAGATAIVVELEEAGLGLIAVVDNGEGMNRADAVAAFQRHATSKIRTIQDLESIATLGFRGEALASIAAVSTTTLCSRRAEDLAGTRVVVEGGKVLEVADVGMPPGTRVEVVGLFANVPARRKFLKAPATEVGQVSEYLTRIALAWPHVGFQLRHGRRLLLDLPAANEPLERLAQVFGRERAESFLAFRAESSLGRVAGWLSPTHFSLPSPRQVFTYVNARYVRDKLLTHALLAGYNTLLMTGRYPAAVLFLELPPSEVDVNVHPAKLEVRFRRGGAVHELVSRGVQERLRLALAPQASSASGAPAAGFTLEASLPPAALLPFDPPPPGTPSSRVPRWVLEVPWRSSSREAADRALHSSARAFRFGELRIVGQVFAGYVVCEGHEELVLLDQHAAHERVVFERLRSSYARGPLPQQHLLIGAVVHLDPQAQARVSEYREEASRLGFDIEPFGVDAVLVRSVPALLAHIDPAQLVRDLAEELVELDRSQAPARATERIFARMACHSAVRVGQAMSIEEIQALLRAMDEVDFAAHCPHGRPAFLAWPRTEIERLFRRV